MPSVVDVRMHPRRALCALAGMVPARRLLPPGLLLLGLLVTACGSSDVAVERSAEASYRHAASAPMTAARIHTAARDLSVRVPEGWRETSDERNAPAILLWLVREDYGASLSFSALTMNPALFDALRRDGLLAVARTSLALKRSNAHDSVRVVVQPELFTLAARAHAAYEYSTDNGASVVRVVVFEAGRRFIECAMTPVAPTPGAAEQRTLFEVQQSVLASLETQ